MQDRPLDVLWVEDSLSDKILIEEALKYGRTRQDVRFVNDGVSALDFLYKRGQFNNSRTPDIVVLDLNIPKKNGKEVLEEIKKDNDLKLIPVIILSTSSSQKDIIDSYALNANCYITKPMGFEDFVKAVNKIQEFWSSIVILPKLKYKN